MSEVCQLYSYSSSDFSFQVGDIQSFTHGFKVADLNKESVHWLNFHDISNVSHIESFCENQEFDRLTAEDILSLKQRPKLEEFDNYMFFSIRSVLPVNESSRLVPEQISFILGDHYLISLQERSSDHFTEIRTKIENKLGKVRDRGADFLLFRMLDAIVDNYFEVLEDVTKSIRRLESKALRNTNRETLLEIEGQKRKLNSLRKIVIPLKDITLQIENGDLPYITKQNAHYFVDLKDSCLSVVDEIDSSKQELEGLTNLYYASQGQRMNEVMKVLTVVSTIFIPLTFIVGVYGMNFDNMPELKWKYGYLMSWIAMIGISILLLVFFIRKGWLKDK